MLELQVLYEDNHLLVIDKPAGLASQGGSDDDHLVARVAAYLKARYAKPGNVYVGLVHRLDRGTSGAIVVARTSKAAERLASAFRDRGPDKTYLALVQIAGSPPPDLGRLEHHVVARDDHGTRVVPAGTSGAKHAALTFEVRARSATACLVEVHLETGRKHQIRVQLAAAGWPLLGDRRYAPPEVASRFHRPALHAWRIALTHPVRGDRCVFEAPIPSDFRGVMAALGLELKPAPRNGV